MVRTYNDYLSFTVVPGKDFCEWVKNNNQVEPTISTWTSKKRYLLDLTGASGCPINTCMTCRLFLAAGRLPPDGGTHSAPIPTWPAGDDSSLSLSLSTTSRLHSAESLAALMSKTQCSAPRSRLQAPAAGAGNRDRRHCLLTTRKRSVAKTLIMGGGRNDAYNGDLGNLY